MAIITFSEWKIRRTQRATALLADMRRLTRGKLPLIGGVGSAAEAYQKIRAGACLVQRLVTEIKKGLAELLRRDGFACVADAVGAQHHLT